MAFTKFGNVSGIEQAPAQVIALVASGIGSPLYFSPKQMTGNLEGIAVTLTPSVVNGATALTTNLTVGAILSAMKIRYGTNQDLTVTGIAQLAEFYHIKKGLTFSDTAMPSTVNQTDTATDTFSLPFSLPYSTLMPIVFEFDFNGYTTTWAGSITSGTVTMQVSFYYTKQKVPEECWYVVSTPTALSSSTEVNIGQYISIAKPVLELWTFATADADLSYYKFEIGNTTIHFLYAFDLITQEIPEPQYTHVSGLFKLPIVVGSVLATASNIQVIPIVELSTSIPILLYVRTG